MKVYTHVNPDLDAIASVWAVLTFCPGAHDAEVVYVPANWDGTGMEDGDQAVDLTVGKKGTQHADGTVGSCFALVVEECAPDDQEALKSLVTFVESQDRHGSAVGWLAPEASREAHRVLTDTGLGAVLRAFQRIRGQDGAPVLEVMSEIFSGMLEAGRAFVPARAEAANAEFFGEGSVAIVRNAQVLTTSVLFDEHGVQVIVYVDGHDLGVIRRHDVSLRMDDPELRRVVQAAGEKVGDGDGKWFAHPAGFLFAHGTRKAPATGPSGVHPENLAEAAARLLARSGDE